MGRKMVRLAPRIGATACFQPGNKDSKRWPKGQEKRLGWMKEKHKEESQA